MIQLQYDPQTSGTRISFVLHSGELTLKVPDYLHEACKFGKAVDGVCTLPQNEKTLEWIKLLAEHAKQGISK